MFITFPAPADVITSDMTLVQGIKAYRALRFTCPTGVVVGPSLSMALTAARVAREGSILATFPLGALERDDFRVIG